MRDASAGPVSTRRTALIGAVLACLYIAWAYPFMMESSVVAIDGRRYFNLFDDAMISMRYAWNFSHGQGLVWNPGERVEGYTNLLLTLIMSVFTSLLDKSAAVLAVQILGVCIVLGCGYLVWTLAGRAGRGSRSSAHRPLFTAAVAVDGADLLPALVLGTHRHGDRASDVVATRRAVHRGKRRPQRERPQPAVGCGADGSGLPDAAGFDHLRGAAARLCHRQGSGGTGQSGGPSARVILAAVLLFLALSPASGGVPHPVLWRSPSQHLLPEADGHAARGPAQKRRGIPGAVPRHACIFPGDGLPRLSPSSPPGETQPICCSSILPIVYQAWTGGDPVSIWRIMAPVQPLAAVLFALGGDRSPASMEGARLHAERARACLQWSPRSAS